MKKPLLFVLLAAALLLNPALSRAASQETIGNGDLTVTLQAANGGMELISIQNAGAELLAASSPLFTLSITDLAGGGTYQIRSNDAWAEVNTSNDGTYGRMTFSDPADAHLPDSLQVTVAITVTGQQSRWDLRVAGLGSVHTLMSAEFPVINLEAEGNDYLLTPKYSGVLTPNPVSAAVDAEFFYPRGWSATMPFLAYYNANYGLYLGFHDPQASSKRFDMQAESGHLHFFGDAVVADKTLAGNDWAFPGHFELDLFQGDWYDAALIYKDWAAAESAYWPPETPERALRQQELGRIGLWGYYSEPASTPMETMEAEMNAFIDYFSEAPVGIHWYQWNYLDFDDDYPNYFPEREGMTGLVSRIQQSGDAYIMPYINGRLYDTDLTGEWDYATRGFPDAAKRSDGTAYTQNFNGNTFAVMCPSQSGWQDILLDAADQLTDRIGSKGVYIDQVAAAGPVEDMDTSHGHPLGGGHWWRDGYAEMFSRIHQEIPAGRFATVEGGADYLADQVDGFLVSGWLTNNLVPAFQVVYSGRVQLFGKHTGTSRYHNQSFYCKLSQAFVQGVAPGRVSLWIVADSNADIARPFVRQIAAMRYKLRDYLAFGTMLRPPEVNGSIPTITSSWTDYGTPVDVTISALQASVYRHSEGDSVAFIFANASMTQTLTFSFDFDGQPYGFSGELWMQEITEYHDGAPQRMNNSFTQEVTLSPLDTVAFLIGPEYHHLFLPVIFTTSPLLSPRPETGNGNAVR